MRVRKLSRTRAENGSARKSSKYYAEWRSDGVLRRIPLYTDKKSSEEAARKIFATPKLEKNFGNRLFLGV